jgi:hypothetical protein
MELVAFFSYRVTQDGDPFEPADKIRVPGLGSTIPLNIFWSLREDGKEHEIKVVIAHQTRPETLEMKYVSNAFRSDISLYAHESVAIEVQKFGKYVLRLLVDGETVSEYPIEIVQDVS